MDNVSHAVVSLVAGELLHRSLPFEASDEKQSLRQKLILFTACAAGNFPDLDLVLYPLLKRPLGYLLHHRGHSHTLAGVCLEAVLLFAIVYALWPAARRLMSESPLARKAFAAAAAIGFALHLSMDWLNSYGVHPFYPFSTHWFYGDLVFIVEPVFWIAFGVPLAFLTRRWSIRYPWLALILGVPLYATFAKHFVNVTMMLVLLVVAAGLATSQAKEFARGRRTLATAWIIGLIFIAGQALCSARARELVTAELTKLEPTTHVLDVALTAFPTNPYCWNFVSIEEGSDVYRLRSGILNLVGHPTDCPPLFETNSHDLTPNIGESNLEIGDTNTLRTLNANNCHLRAWMRFARMPFVTREGATDLRFSRGGRVNFSSLSFEAFRDEPCSSWIPPWEPPRDDLLDSH